MISKTSLYSKGLVKSNLKRFWWISALSAIIMLFLLPLRFMMYDQRAIESLQQSLIYGNSYRTLFERFSPFFFFTALAIPIFIAVLLMRYMQKSNSATTLHGLPFTRNKLFFNTVLSGIILNLAPAILNVAILVIIKPLIPAGTIYSLADVFTWFGMQVLYSSVMFFIAVFVGIFTGSSIAQIVFTVIINILPFILYQLFGITLAKFLRGFDLLDSDTFFRNLPIINMFEGIENTTMAHVVWYLVLSAVLLALALFFYNRRHIETATDVVTFKWVDPLFKYGVTTCAMLSGYLFIESIVTKTPGAWLYFFWALVGYVIAEMLLKKTLNIWRSYKGFIAYCLVVFVVYGGVALDITGFEKRVPVAEDIESVYVGGSGYYWKNYLDGKIEDGRYSYIESGVLVYEEVYRPNTKPSTIYFEKENIKTALSLHNAIIEGTDVDRGDSIFIGYKLRNGRTLYRRYSVDSADYKAYLKALAETAEYKKINYPIRSEDLDKIKYIEVMGRRSSESVLISDRDKLSEFVQILEKDVLNITYEEMNPEFTFSEVTLRVNYGERNHYEIHISLYDSMKATREFLVQNEYYQDGFPPVSEIESIYTYPMPKTVKEIETLVYYKDNGKVKSESTVYTDEDSINKILSENIVTWIGKDEIPIGDLVFINMKDDMWDVLGYIPR